LLLPHTQYFPGIFKELYLYNCSTVNAGSKFGTRGNYSTLLSRPINKHLRSDSEVVRDSNIMIPCSPSPLKQR